MASAILDELETYGPQHCEQLDYEQASAYVSRLARTHYENFSVVSWLLPRRLRDDFRHVYAFCRWADDLGDETGDRERSLELLDWWRSELDRCYADQPRHPVFVALHRTIQRHDIPRKPFDDLIDAFIQDQRVTRYDTFEQVLDYCTRSADPVGRLVLYLCGHRDEQRQRLSDRTCTALQLANFWQDIRRDVLDRDRIYIPRDVAQRHELDLERMAVAIRADEAAGGGRLAHEAPELVRAATASTRELVERTWPLFREGRQLLPKVAPDVRVDIALFSSGGEAILRRIARQGYNTLSQRPSLSRGAKLALMCQAAWGKLTGRLRGGASGSDPAESSTR